MKRWQLLTLVLIVVVLSVVGVRYALGRPSQKEREATYQSTLRSYNEALKLGMPRQQVEDYLKTKGTKFLQMCCVAQHTGAYDDLVKIGREDAPWYCSEQNIYVAFQFTADERRRVSQANPSDKLREVTIFRWLEGCL